MHTITINLTADLIDMIETDSEDLDLFWGQALPSDVVEFLQRFEAALYDLARHELNGSVAIMFDTDQIKCSGCTRPDTIDSLYESHHDEQRAQDLLQHIKEQSWMLA